VAFVRIIENLTSLGSGDGAFMRFRPAAVVRWDVGKIPGRS
jgi:hypothetical protein